MGLPPGTEETSTELAGNLKSKLILLDSTQLQIDQYKLEELNKVVQQVNAFCSVISDVKIQSRDFCQNMSVVSSRILVLLYKFSESPDSLLGYQLCLELVKQGYDLYVTTTSTAKWLKSENAKAEELSGNYPGSIKVLSAQCNDEDQRSPEWI